MRRHDPRIVSVYLAGVPAMNKRAIDSANDLMIDLIAVAALQPWNISETHRVLLPCRTVGGRVLGQNSRRHLSQYRVITFLIAVTLLSSLAALLDSRSLFGHAGTLGSLMRSPRLEA